MSPHVKLKIFLYVYYKKGLPKSNLTYCRLVQRMVFTHVLVFLHTPQFLSKLNTL